MALKKEFFFHQNFLRFNTKHNHLSPHQSLGWSMLVKPVDDLDESGATQCDVTVTRCNYKDKHFNKKIARALLRERTPDRIKVKDLPYFMGEVQCLAAGVTPFRNCGDRFNYILKNWL